MTKLLIAVASIAMAQPAMSADKLKDQIVCSTVKLQGHSDDELKVVIQSNPTAWEKRASIVEHGVLGAQVIGTYKIPLTQPLVTTPSFFEQSRVATYEANGFQLKMKVGDANGEQVLGPAHVRIQLRGYASLEADMTCKSVKSKSQ